VTRNSKGIVGRSRCFAAAAVLTSALLGSLRAGPPPPLSNEVATDDPAAELWAMAQTLALATLSPDPNDWDSGTIRKLSTQLATFELRHGLSPSAVENWEALRSEAAAVARDYEDANRSAFPQGVWTGGYISCGPASTLCALLELGGRRDEVERLIFPPAPIEFGRYSPWAPLDQFADLAVCRAEHLQLAGDASGALRAALAGCFHQGPCSADDILFEADVGLLLAQQGFAAEAILVLRHVAHRKGDDLAHSVALDELARLGDPPGGQAVLLPLELFDWARFVRAPAAVVAWDPQRRGSLRLLAVREGVDEAADQSATDQGKVHTLVDGLVPARDFIDELVCDYDPAQRWNGRLMLAALDPSTAAELEAWIRAVPDGDAGAAVGTMAADRVARALCGGGPQLDIRKLDSVRTFRDTWLDWLAAHPGN
jgi:hypothetical protein